MHRGLYALRCLPFGLKVAPRLFQLIMDGMLAGRDYVMAYSYDILIKSENTEQHKRHVREVFKRINENGFKLGLESTNFLWKE